MDKILGLDLGTNSIGWAIRNTSLPENQLEKYGVITFDKGVGEKKGIEFSRAAERTSHRSSRRRYQAHKYKLWATLEILIEHDYCPLTMDGLNQWRKYAKPHGRIYPLNEESFNNWIRLDFDGDGKPDYSSPYQLRHELATIKHGSDTQNGRYKIGRALYHIAQHRAFKSSKKVQDKDAAATSDQDMIGAEKKRAKFIEGLLEKHQVSTVGSAFAMEENQGNRIRQNLHQHVIRKQLQQEVTYIFEFQGISFIDIFKKEVSKSSIFWQRPLRSQKGTVGKCSLEPSKYRCPVSHPKFEAFRAWSFLNNIYFRTNKTERWHQIDLSLKEKIYQEKYFRISVSDFDFIEIKTLIEKHNQHKNWELNYRDNVNVSASPVSARLKDIFGENWQDIQINKPIDNLGESQKNYYNIDDIWHVLFSFDDEDELKLFATEKLQLPAEKTKKIVELWYKMPESYAMLSLKALSKIVPFLRMGHIYTEAVLLAKMPDVLGKELWEEKNNLVADAIKTIIELNKKEKRNINIANSLIANYKGLENNLKFAVRDYDYVLQEDDKAEIELAIKDNYGEKTWLELSKEKKADILAEVTSHYQAFFKDKKRAFIELPLILETLKQFIRDNFDVSEKQIDTLYHPSQIDIYPPAKESYYEAYNAHFTLLQTPKTGAFKNPMAMRALYELRKLINYLICTHQIDESTKITVELARELNDANMRWAIETYQRQKQEENKEFALALMEILREFPEQKVSPNKNEDIDKFRLWFEQLDDENAREEKNEKPQLDWIKSAADVYKKVTSAKEMIDKYRIWKEQSCQCMYTGRIISLMDLFSENNIDFEHTIPRSISFDNSMANLTLCDFSYNRTIKKNSIPTSLPNYDNSVDISGKHYSAIKPRLKKWELKVEMLRNNVKFWVKKSKGAATKEAKDNAVRQRHLWQFELDYWENKLGRFTLKEVKAGFKNSQLVDTQLISKYAYHYLKTVFHSVKVQKGSITAEFRKIYGIQSPDEKKDRSKHSHHAKDAAILTLIPVDSKREEILKKSYEQYEKYHHQFTLPPYNGFRRSFIDEIEDNILVNSITKDRALDSNDKRVRVRGKKVYIKDEFGNKKEKRSNGDSIRGQLHLDTFYGKIKVVKRSEEGKPQKDENGDWIPESKNGGFGFVSRKLITKELNVETIVDPHLRNIFISQMNGRTLEKTLKDDQFIWMLNKNGEKVHPIRHVRCFAKDVTEPLAIKKQSHLSSKEYKQMYWAKNGENYAYALYQGIIKNKIVRSFTLINLFDASKLKKLDGNQALNVEQEMVINAKGEKIPLYTILKTGQRVLFYQNGNPDELQELDNIVLSKRLYAIMGFEKENGRILFGHHLDARNDKQLREIKNEHGALNHKGFSSINYENPWPRLRLSLGNFDFLIEGKNFTIMPDGKIEFKDLILY